MRQRHVIALSWKSPQMSAAGHEYYHPECLRSELHLAVISVMQDTLGRACDVSEGDTRKQMRAISPLDLPFGERCFSCSQKLSSPPVSAYGKTRASFLQKEDSL